MGKVNFNENWAATSYLFMADTTSSTEEYVQHSTRIKCPKDKSKSSLKSRSWTLYTQILSCRSHQNSTHFKRSKFNRLDNDSTMRTGTLDWQSKCLFPTIYMPKKLYQGLLFWKTEIHPQLPQLFAKLKLLKYQTFQIWSYCGPD